MITSHRSDHHNCHYKEYSLDLLVLKMLNLLKSFMGMLDLNSFLIQKKCQFFK